ncbi:hypothetical protein KY285_013224 [Solanum tuberosum]|nr:hypothetical protein KY285_013224 [Solanum tuberosum]
MDEIYNYEHSSAQATDEVESSEENSDNGDEETNRDSRDTGDEDDDPLSLPTCAREISGKSYNLTTWMDELESFPAKISVKARMTLFQDFRNVLLQEKNYNDFKEFALITGLNCLAYPRDAKMKKVLPKKSLDSPLSIPRLLRWHMAKSDNIIEGDPYKYKGRSTKVVHPYIISTVCETKQNYMATLKPYTDEVKDTIIDDLKANLKGVTVLTSAEGNVEDEYSNDHNPNQSCCFPRLAKEVDEEMKEEEMKEEERQQDDEKMTEKEEEKMEENDEEKEEEKLEEKKEEESEEENLEEKKN